MGGLAGHMMHPHDNLKLMIGQFDEIFYKTICGKLPMSEKLDGFNIHILNKEGEIRFARNNKDLMEGGFSKTEIENRFTNDRVREVFRKGFEMAEADDRFKMLPDWDLFHYTMNVEIIVGCTNIMPYGQDMLVPHNLYRWGIWEGNAHVNSIDELPGAFKTNLPFTMLDFEADFNDSYWDERFINVFGEFEGTHTLEDYYRHKFTQVVMAVMEGEYQFELVQAMFNRFFGVGEKVNLRELRKEFGSENVQKFLDIEKQLVFLTKDDLDQLVLEMGTYILDHFRGLNWSTGSQYNAMDNLHFQVMDVVKSDPEGTKVFVHRWMACKGKVFATEGIVVEYEGNRYKWTGPFAPVNQLLGGRR